MKWQGLVAAAAVLGAVTGCQAQQGGLAPAQTAHPVQRFQKPDAETIRQTSLSTRPLEPIAEKGDGQVVAAIRATVNGVPILDQEVLAASLGLLQGANHLPEPERSQQIALVKNKVLDMLIERELILQDVKNRFSKGPAAKFLEKLKEAGEKEFDRQIVRTTKKKYNLKTDDDLKSFLANQGLSLESLRRQWERTFIYQQYLQFLAGPKLDRIGHEAIDEYYHNHPEEFQAQDSVEWQDIFIAASRFRSRDEARQFAESLRARATAGADFAALAKEHDMGTSRFTGGTGIGEKRGEIRPREAEAVVFRLRDGEVGELVELENGFHIVRVVKRVYAGQKPFDEATQDAIRDKLKGEVLNREVKSYIASLTLHATIEKLKYQP
jgi:parvulin-like peptidyl-prolyl isomerase